MKGVYWLRNSVALCPSCNNLPRMWRPCAVPSGNSFSVFIFSFHFPFLISISIFRFLKVYLPLPIGKETKKHKCNVADMPPTLIQNQDFKPIPAAWAASFVSPNIHQATTLASMLTAFQTFSVLNLCKDLQESTETVMGMFPWLLSLKVATCYLLPHTNGLTLMNN